MRVAWGEGSGGRGVGARGPCQGGVRHPTVILREGMAILQVSWTAGPLRGCRKTTRTSG